MPRKKVATTTNDLIEMVPDASDEWLEQVRLACIKDRVYGGIHLAVVLEQLTRAQALEKKDA